MKLYNIASAIVLASLGVLQQVSSAKALTWDLNLTGSNFNGSAQLITDGTSYSTGNIYTLLGISGTVNGSPITGVDSNVFVDGYIPDQKLEWNGSNQLLIDTDGLGFDTAQGNRYNPYPEGSDQALVFAPADTLEVIYPGGSHTHYSESYTLTPVPEPSELLGILALGFIGLVSRFQRKNLAQRNAD